MANVLAVNSGSSSLKFALYSVQSTEPELLFSGEADEIGAKVGTFLARNGKGEVISETTAFSSQQDAIVRMAETLAAPGMPKVDAIGHRIVHGGPSLRTHCRIDEAVLAKIEGASRFAPLHIPAALSAILFTQAHFPGTPQIACFDTVFHTTMPDIARILPLSRELEAEGVQRYGFHGLSCESVLAQLSDDLPKRIVIAHLGSGASITAVKHGISIDTSMGLTPTGGVIMGTRSGDLDPGVLIYLMREKRLDAVKLEELVDRRSGLLGVSGIDSDMRRLRAAASGNPDAHLAIAMFAYSVRKHIAGMIAALGGVDLLVFTGGIGENDAAARFAICDGLLWAGIVLDAERNGQAANPIGAVHAPCHVLALHSEEEKQIARHASKILSAPFAA